ncbi:MAG: hypothetical protein MI861_05835 [Pirellulales bacterium]|nr:hypothetical protein [Pirellulales bacterium]
MTKQKIHFGLGIVVWTVAVGWVASAARVKTDAADSRMELVRYFTTADRLVETVDPSAALRRHDPVFFQTAPGQWRQVGYVRRGHGEVSPEKVQILWHDGEVLPGQCQLTLYRNRGRLEDVVATMLPPDKRRQIQNRLAAAMTRHGEELSAEFVPLVRKSLRQSLPVIEDEFRRASARHRKEIDRLARRWNRDIVSEHLIPLARREIMPIVQKHGQPTAERIGRELWDRASLWRFGWRAIYDRAPLPERNLVQAEWDRFVKKEAVPVFESHMDEIVVAVQRVVTDVSANATVRSELSDVADDLAADPETRKLIRSILKETLLDNERLRKVWNDVWNSEEARRTLTLAGERMEPVVREIGDDLFGTEQEGIDPNFARVLRNQILGKDRRWIVATLSDQPDAHRLEVSDERMPFPIVYLADSFGQGEVSP